MVGLCVRKGKVSGQWGGAAKNVGISQNNRTTLMRMHISISLVSVSSKEIV
jgi:hypothetical protein